MKKGDLRVCVMTNVPSEFRYYSVPSPEIGLLLIETLADEMLLCEHDIISNIFILEEYLGDYDGENNSGWCEWYSEEGDTIDNFNLTNDFKLVIKESNDD